MAGRIRERARRSHDHVHNTPHIQRRPLCDQTLLYGSKHTGSQGGTRLAVVQRYGGLHRNPTPFVGGGDIWDGTFVTLCHDAWPVPPHTALSRRLA